MNFPLGLKRSAAMIVLRCEQHFLLLKRANAPNQGMYVPVGGKLEPHEDPYTAALRELQEETGLVLDKLRYGGVLVESSPTKYNWQSNIYIANIDYISPPFCDEGILEWIAFDQVLSFPTPPTDWHIYQFLMQERPFAINAIYDEKLQLLSMIEEISGQKLV